LHGHVVSHLTIQLSICDGRHQSLGVAKDSSGEMLELTPAGMIFPEIHGHKTRQTRGSIIHDPSRYLDFGAQEKIKQFVRIT
jgi:hypothetical protein